MNKYVNIVYIIKLKTVLFFKLDQNLLIHTVQTKKLLKNIR